MAANSAWCFLTNHAQVLVCISRNPDVLLKDVATQMGVTERAVQRIVADLVDAQFIVRNRVGRQNRYEIRGDLPLLHPLEAGVRVKEALLLFGMSAAAENASQPDPVV